MTDPIGPDGERLLPVGELVGVHGIRGELRMRPFNADSTLVDEVEDLFLVDANGGSRSVRAERSRPHGTVWLLALEGVTTPERARALVGSRIAVRERELPELEPGQFYCFQLVGLDVVDAAGGALGKVAEVLSNPGNDVLVVRDARKERLFPMVDAVVRSVDVASRRIVVDPIDGLLD